MIAITGANGQLGTLVVQHLLEKLPPEQIVAAVRTPKENATLRKLGVDVREADYDRPETLRTALSGAEKVLLISAVVPGQRLRQHKAVIDAAREVGVSFLAYTSMLKAESSSHILAAEHRATEQYLAASGMPYAFLRNAWYLENHTGVIGAALEHGALVGCAGEGRFASASREDLAAGAVAVLTGTETPGQTYELAGDASFSMREYAQELSRQTGRSIVYNDMEPTAYTSLLTSFGLPPMIVDVIVDADLKSQRGDFDSSSRTLSQLLGRPTTTLSEAIEQTLRKQ
jgi:NAD(P)H dehydrogenase (quinone)